MTGIRNFLRRSTALLAALSLLSMLIAGDFALPSMAAAAQVTTRSLTVSSSANGSTAVGAAGTGGNGAKAKHTVGFTMGTSGATIGSVALIYCDSPIPQTACTSSTAATGNEEFVTNATTSITGLSGTWSLDTTTNNPTITGFGTCNGATTTRQNCVLLKAASAAANVGTPAVSIGYGGGAASYVVNPTNDNNTFYVRIVAFSDTGYATPVDNGAVASSTAQQIDITAKVQEKLNFSVGKTYVAPSTTCVPFSDDGAVALGDSNGVLDSATAYDAHSYFRVSTNATNGTSVLYSGDTLKSGASTITGLASETLSTPGTAQFGLGFNTASSEHSFTSLTADTGYDEANGNINPVIAAKFNFNTGSVTTPVPVATTAGIITCDTGDIRYIGNIAANTPAGIYTTTVTYIAVPTY